MSLDLIIRDPNTKVNANKNKNYFVSHPPLFLCTLLHFENVIGVFRLYIIRNVVFPYIFGGKIHFSRIHILKSERINTLDFIIQTPPYKPYFETRIGCVPFFSDYEI